MTLKGQNAKGAGLSTNNRRSSKPISNHSNTRAEYGSTENPHNEAGRNKVRD